MTQQNQGEANPMQQPQELCNIMSTLELEQEEFRTMDDEEDISENAAD